MSGVGDDGAVTVNIAQELAERALATPDRSAVVVATGRRTGGGRAEYESYTFAELDSRAGRYAAGLHRIGITRGTRTVLMVKPGREFFALVFALYRVGAVLVLIDPGIEKTALKECLREVEPEAFVGVPLAHVARIVFGSALGTVTRLVTVGRRLFWGGVTLDQLLDPDPLPMTPTTADETAAILFTSGSTGVPKGAVYTHGIFSDQVRMLREVYGFAPDEVDLSTFPLFALFMAALGFTSVIPDMDARKPGSADAEKLLEAIVDHGCTNMFGSPALLERLSNHGRAHGTKLPTLRRVLSAGAPVRHDILSAMRDMLNEGVQVFTPYGATEALPVCNVGSDEILGETHALTAAGAGVCVGRPVEEMTVRLIRITEDVIGEWSDELEVPVGEVGEITVKGPVVTQEYYARREATAASKIADGSDIVHRMGDLGRFDEQGRLWMCGRKAHRVRAAAGDVFTVPVEMVFNALPGVRRTALVGVPGEGAQRPVLVVEPDPSSQVGDVELAAYMMAVAEGHAVAGVVSEVLVHRAPFPVDIRHNAKIRRAKVAAWATARLGA